MSTTAPSGIGGSLVPSDVNFTCQKPTIETEDSPCSFDDWRNGVLAVVRSGTDLDNILLALFMVEWPSPAPAPLCPAALNTERLPARNTTNVTDNLRIIAFIEIPLLVAIGRLSGKPATTEVPRN